MWMGGRDRWKKKMCLVLLVCVCVCACVRVFVCVEEVPGGSLAVVEAWAGARGSRVLVGRSEPKKGLHCQVWSAWSWAWVWTWDGGWRRWRVDMVWYGLRLTLDRQNADVGSCHGWMVLAMARRRAEVTTSVAVCRVPCASACGERRGALDRAEKVMRAGWVRGGRGFNARSGGCSCSRSRCGA